MSAPFSTLEQLLQSSSQIDRPPHNCSENRKSTIVRPCVEIWDQDHWNDDLWCRITDVNADRSNQIFIRPKAGTVQGCQFASKRLHDRLLDTCNLPNYQTENHLRSMYLINNRDVVDHKLMTSCHDRCDRDKILSQKPIQLDNCTPYFQQRTQELYRTVDYRNTFTP